MKKFLVLISVLPLLASAPIALAAVGDTCVPTDPSACLGASPAEICDPNTSKCVDPSQTQASPTLPQTQSQAPASSGGGLNSNATSFFPLTSLPGLTDIATKNDVSGFLQNVYKICIGIAAVLAVLQLVRAGVLYMGGDSVTETKEARRLIGVALGGLLLVLSPVIVFSIINPQILQLNIGVTNLSSSANPST